MRAHRGKAQAGGPEQSAPFRGRLGREHPVEDGPQLRLVVFEVQEMGEAIDQVGSSDRSIEEVTRGTSDTDDRDPPIGSREDAVNARDHGMTTPTRTGHVPRHQVTGVFAGLGPHLTPEERGLNQLPPSGALPCIERGEQACEEVLTGDVVGDGRPDRTGVAAIPTRRADEPTRRLCTQVCTFTRRVGALCSERGPHGVDDPRIARRRVLVPEAPAVHRAGLEIGDDDVGLLDESEEDLAAPWYPQVDGDASFAPVVGGEESRAPVFPTDREPPALVAEPRELHLDHLGTPFEHGERRLRPLDEQTRLQHPNAVEQAHPTSDSRGPDAEVHDPTLVTSGAKVKRPYSPCS